jgi:hypothetical protein
VTTTETSSLTLRTSDNESIKNSVQNFGYKNIQISTYRTNPIASSGNEIELDYTGKTLLQTQRVDVTSSFQASLLLNLNSTLLEKQDNIIKTNPEYKTLSDLFNSKNSNYKIQNLGKSMSDYLENNKDLYMPNIFRIESVIKNQFINFEKNFSIQNKKMSFSDHYEDSDLEN